MSRLSERLTAYNQPLLPKMVQLKYEAMAENQYRFYRGTCHLFYEDLAQADNFPQSPIAWVCGDLHLENFGSYKADNKLVYFDLNDFDESIKAPAAWELIRLICSIFIAFDSLEIGQDKALSMAKLFLKTYAETLVKGKAYSIDPRTAQGIVCDFLTAAENNNQKVILRKRTEEKKHKIVLSLADERHIKIKKPLRAELYNHIEQWIANSSDSPYNFKVKDAVFRVAGTGSIGLKRYLFLLKSTNTKDKYLLLDMKQSTVSALSPYLNNIPQPEWTTESDRIVTVQQRMQYISASLLSTTVFREQPFVLQELQPVKDSIKFKLIKDRYRDIYRVIDDMAMLTASAQLRSAGMDGTAPIDELIQFGKDPNWQEALVNYALKYTGQIKAYYHEFLSDYKGGVLEEPLKTEQLS
ncbi:DUF2252 domain-containing protein [Mucilaginibacter polytrichastri]|uniref:DUF2252 domain-containing protein n=1 Tax=Mucilaginibacter polytrichastri TaxID=1302689 RepID=A0A1Q6A3F2_9SPHI|nr:DUF2252 family protein [Mucilaginibacter polytrichastri]OKS88535.1 hypothetical protein RG47T_4004 [Mucilaginibacter polytrichastri]SFT11768.1 Uncharacterized conserved protein, DUF2252 family [Mucilaginibacter polytrichastri]